MKTIITFFLYNKLYDNYFQYFFYKYFHIILLLYIFFINIFKIPDFLTDNRVNIFSKFKLIFSLLTAILYIISGIDLIPEIITGMFGFIDDIFVLVWSLGIVNEEIEKYKKILKDSKDPNVIENVNYNIYDEDE